jgi:hypothetical protein
MKFSTLQGFSFSGYIRKEGMGYMNKESEIKKELPARKILAFGVTIAALYWFFDASVEAFILKEGGFVESILAPEKMEAWMRIMIMGLIIGLSVFARKHVIELEKI